MLCTQCGQQFEYFTGEVESYDKLGVLRPLNCQECRQRRRLAFRNEKNLYHNKSYKSGRQMISTYPASSPFRIIDQDEWWDDGSDATIYGRDFDFNRPFFEQFKELQKDVPRWSRMFVNCENSDFTNNSANIKNGYLSFSSYNSEDIFYCMRTFGLFDCVDCLNVKDSQHCSECADCKKCHNVHYSQLSEGCSDSYFLYDCKGCTNCILSAQIRNKEFVFLNKQYGKEQYESLKKEFFAKLFQNKNQILKMFDDLRKNALHKNMRLLNAENSLGDFINDSRNILNGFYIVDSQDCINVFDSSGLKDCHDCCALDDESELCIECDTTYKLYNCKFCTYSGNSSNTLYSDQCFFIDDCFGCIGLRKRKYSILNKVYSKDEYVQMIAKITEHMKATGEYGQPFPISCSSYPYNITVAHQFYPLEKSVALGLGCMWHEEENSAQHFGQKYEISSDLSLIDESICNKILVCEKTGKNYKIIPQEFKFYKKFGLPIPRVCPDQRYKDMLKLQPPKKLADTKCFVCGTDMKTVYPREFGYKVVCEGCYLKEVY